MGPARAGRSARIGLVALGLVLAAMVLRMAEVRLGPEVLWQSRLAWRGISHSAPMRWWRCRGIARPRLAGSGVPWTLTYSWTGGMGPGDVAVRLSSDGHAVVETRPVDGAAGRIEHALPPEAVMAVARTVDESGLLCLGEEPHPDFIVNDLGRYAVEVEAGSYAKVVAIDECRSVADPMALGAVQEALLAVRPSLGESVSWGPYGTVTTHTMTPCRRGSAAPG